MTSRSPILIAIASAAIVAGAILYLTTRPEPEPPPGTAAPVDRPAAPVAAPAPKAENPAPEPGPPAARPARAPRKAALAPEAAPAEPAAPTTATLDLTTDVPGATVFLDREYVGTTPLKLQGLAPGSKRLQLSADGYDGISRTVDLSAGPNEVALRFREVRLDKRVGVVHKHGMGSCEGTLIATVDGLQYQSAHKNDAFTLGFDRLETFTVDYLEKNLRVKQKGGKTWNFTQKTAASADELFVFHRDVDAARQKLDQGYAPVKP